MYSSILRYYYLTYSKDYFSLIRKARSELDAEFLCKYPLHFADVGQIDHDIGHYEDLIKKHRRLVAYLQGQRNRLAPYARLPVELLAQVFTHVVLDWSCYSHRDNAHSYRWLTITRVSRHWREVALSTPRLFSYILLPYGYDLRPASRDALSEKLFLQWLSRAKTSLLTITIALTLSRELLESISMALPRTRALTLKCDLDRLLNVQEKCTSLKHLCLSQTFGLYSVLNLISMAPEMESIELSNQVFVFDHIFATRFSSLVTLHILYDSELGKTIHSSTDVTSSALRNLPSLQTLEIYDLPDTIHDDQDDLSKNPVCTQFHVNHLALSGGWPFMYSILEHTAHLNSISVDLTSQ